MENKKKVGNKWDTFVNIFIIICLVFISIYLLFNFTGFNKNFDNLSFGQNYQFLSKTSQDEDLKSDRSFYKSEIENLVNKYLQETGITTISLYYRDLNNGYVFGINERALFAPASLTKVPTMIAVLKKIEDGYLSLDEETKVKNINNDLYTYYTPFLKIKNNAVYSIGELLEYMIKYSDNGATFALWGLLSGYNSSYYNVYRDLKIDFSGDYVEVVDYSSLFKILYNSSYLNKRYSEYALSLLSKALFDKGLKKYLPSNIVVAHKFGEFTYNGSVKQLHNCGIIYYPKHPYILCIMTRGSSYEKLEDTIGNLSKFLFEKVKNNFSN